MRLSNEREATQFLNEAVRSYEPMRLYVGRQMGINRCMFTGKQWITEDMMYGYMNELGRHLSNYNPDTNKLRIVLNRIPKLIDEVAAATFPEMIEFNASPPERDMGAESAMRSQILTATLAAAVENTGFLKAARECNKRRCIDGLHGIGLTVKRENRAIGDSEESDCVVKAFTFDAHRLILDPIHQELDLWDHEYVIYRDVWTVTKIERELGVKLNPDELKTVGQLMPLEMAMNRLSQNRLYTYLKEFSQTKGAFVYQVHIKDNSGRFPTMLIGYDSGENDPTWINFDDQESPFGGHGLPFMLLHGYREPDIMVSQSDVARLKGDQDRINLLSTMFFRVLQKYSGFQWLVQQESMIGDGADDMKSQFNNYVGGLVQYKGSTSRDRPVMPPQLVQSPQPQAFLQEAISMYQERDMPAQIHRAPVTSGATKSHVPDSTYQSAKEAAGQVMGNRQREDMDRYESFAGVLLGTYVKLVQKGSPSALVQLRRSGFDGTDFAMLHGVDPYYPACDITLTDRSIRYRSTEQKEQSLDAAAQLQMVSPIEYRRGRAALGSPITEEDRIYDTAAKKEAMEVLLGGEWMPRSLGNATDFFVSAFRNATFDRRAKTDPSAMKRLDDAVAMMLAFANMELQNQTMAENPQPPAPSPAPAEPQQEVPKEVNVADLLMNMMNSGAGSQMAQPSLA